jgi:hypothetical protein
LKLATTFIGKLNLIVFLLLVFGFQIQIFIPVFLKIPSQPIAIAYRGITLILALYLLIIGLVHDKNIHITKGGFLLIGFWFLYLLRVFYDIQILELNEIAYPYQGKLYYYSYIIGSGFIPLISILLTIKYINLKQNWWIVLFFSLIQICVAYYLLLNQLDSLKENFLKYRVAIKHEGGSVFNPITMAKFGSIAFILGFSNIIFNPSTTIRLRIICLFLCGSGILFIILGGSRGPLIAFILGVLLFIYYYFKITALTQMKVLKIITYTITIILTLNIILIPKINVKDTALLYRMEKTFFSESSVEDPREVSWNSAIEQFLHNPHVGDQMFDAVYWQYPHNVILEAFMATGIFGGTIFLIIYLIALINLLNFKKDPYALITLAPVSIITLVGSMFSGGLYFNPELWGVLAVLLGYQVKNDQ